MCAAVLAAAVSCNTDEEGVVLDTPVLSIADTTSTSFTVAWEAVENADMYTYEFREEQASTESLSVTFDGLIPDSMYTVKVKAVSTSASVESEWAEISVTLLSQEAETPKLNLVAEMTDRFTLNVRTSPTDKELSYYFEPLPGSVYEDAGNEPEAVLQDMLASYLQYYGDAATAFAELAMTGDGNRNYDITEYAEAEFHVVGAGIDAALGITTDVEHVVLSVDVPVSDNTFDVSIVEKTQSRIVVSVVPSNSDQYAIILQDKETVDAMSGVSLRRFLLGLVTDNSLCTGEETMTYEKNIVPSHDYTVLVFGYEDGMMTTDVSREDVRTPDPEAVPDLEFTFNINPTGPQEAEVEVVPSNQSAAYFYDVVTADAWYNTYQGSAQNVIEAYASNYGMTVSRYLEQFGSTGPQNCTYGSFVLTEPGGDYVLFAIGYNIENGAVTFTTQDYEEFSTPDDGGHDLGFYFDIYPQSAGEVFIRVTPTDDEASYFYDVMPIEDWTYYYSYEPSMYIEEMAYPGSVVEYLRQYGSTGVDENMYSLAPGEEYVVFAIGYAVSGETVTYLNYEFAGFTAPEDQGGDPGDGLTFYLSIEGETNGEFVVDIQPSDETAPYIYAVMTDSEYDDFYPDNLYDYFYGRYENSGYNGTFAQYIEENTRTGDYYGTSTGFYNDGSSWFFKLVAAGVTVEGDEVTFHSQAEMENFYETW